jgi:mRNA interferase MazF
MVWDIVSVEFPFADQAAMRRRPALVIATPDIGQDFGIVWLLMITSARHTRWPSDVAVTQLPGTGLAHACVVRSAKVATVDARLVTRIGTLAAVDRKAVRDSLAGLMNETFRINPSR